MDYKAMMCSKIITYVAQEPSIAGDINSLLANVCSSIVIGKTNDPASKITADSQQPTLFSFELISENVSKILRIKWIQTITWYL